MKKKLKNLLCTVVTFVIILLSVHFLGIRLCPDGLDSAADVPRVFHGLPENSVDVLCLGSSHMWHGIDPLTIYRDHGFAAYNYGCLWQKMNTTLLFLEDAFRTQSPSVVVIDTFYANRLKRDCGFDGELYSTEKIRLSRAKISYLYECFGKNIENYLFYIFPLAAFHYNWQALFTDAPFDGAAAGAAAGFEISADALTDTKDLYTNFGFAALSGSVGSRLPDTPAEQLPLADEAVTVLDDIVKLCRKHGAEVLFVTIPYEKAYPYSDAIKNYAAANGCGYIDLFEKTEEMKLDPETDFSDASHLNSSGAAKTASFLGKYLKEHYDLPDLRGTDNIWEKAVG